MRFEKKIEIVNIFRIQVKMSTFVQFQLNQLNVNENWQIKLFFLFFCEFKKKCSLKIEFELRNIIKKLTIQHFEKITGSTLKNCKFQHLHEVGQDKK